MSTTVATLTTTQTAERETAERETAEQATPSLRRTTIRIGLIGAAGTTAAAAALHATGVSFDVDGEIPLMAFAQMAFLGAVIGGVIAAVLRRRSVDPAHRFVQVCVALTALSCVPSV